MSHKIVNYELHKIPMSRVTCSEPTTIAVQYMYMTQHPALSVEALQLNTWPSLEVDVWAVTGQVHSGLL